MRVKVKFFKGKDVAVEMYIGGVNNKDEHFVDARDGVSYIVPRKLAEKLKLLVVVEVR